MEKIDLGYDLKVDYGKLFGDWEIPFENLTNSDYMYNLMIFLNETYKKYPSTRPDKTDIFKAFRLTQFSNLRVVILGQDPYPNYKSTGLAFANPSNTFCLSPSLQMIKNCVEKQFHNGSYTDFDPTLESWAKQGVLMLNTALTVPFGESGAHAVYWREFIRQFIKVINSWKHGIIFMLWGAEARMYEKLINNNHYIFTYHHPSWSYRNKTDWNCHNFNQANLIIEKNNGKELCINW